MGQVMTRMVVLAGVVLLVGACGSAGDGTAPGSSGSAPSKSTTTPVEPESPTTPSTTDGGAVIEVTGTVTAGVEAGCLVFTPQPARPDGPWVLVGEVAGLGPGDTVTLRGAVREDIMTICQQGKPFRVEAVVRR